MYTAFLISQVVSALILILLILLQEKSSGLGEAIAGSAAGSIETTKRGAEKVLSRLTVLFLAIFLILSLALNFV